MELNNTIDPDTGFPKLPEGHHWLISPATVDFPPAVRLRKDIGKQYSSQPVRNGFWRNLFLMPTRFIDIEDYSYDRYEVLAVRPIHPFVYERPEDTTEYTHYTSRYEHCVDKEWWFKTYVDREMIKREVEEAWNEFIIKAHEEAIGMTMYGMFPPNKFER